MGDVPAKHLLSSFLLPVLLALMLVYALDYYPSWKWSASMAQMLSDIVLSQGVGLA
jgi:hypothetical protein